MLWQVVILGRIDYVIDVIRQNLAIAWMMLVTVESTLAAAGAVVTQNTVVESGTIYAGVPAKKVKDINKSDFAGEIERISNNYVMYSSWFKEE